MVYLDTPQALVEWDPVIRCVVLEWRDFAYGEEYRLVLDTTLKALVDHNGHKFLSDARRMKAAPQEDQDWLMQNWVPRSAKAGLKNMAIVTPKSTLGQMTLQRLVQVSTGSKRFVSNDGASYFETVEEAKKWLKSLP